MRLLRVSVWVAALALLLAACEPKATTDLTTPPLQPPGLAEPGTTNGLDGSTRDPTSEMVQLYRGALPDGTDYTISIRQDRTENVTLDYAPIVFGPTGSVLVARMARVADPPDSGTPPTFDEGVFRAFVGEWVVELVFDQSLIDEIGADVAEVVLSSISVDDRNGFPVLSLLEPFAWDLGGIPPEIRYESFVVRPGCGALAVLCSDRQVIQVIPSQSLYPGTPSLFGDVLSVETESARPVANPNFLESGPLSSRTIPDVVWTGTEMVIWGGGEADDPYLIDGARFDPATNIWRTLPPAPLAAQQPTRSLWVGERLLVVSAESTIAWNPGSDSWELVEPAGIEPPSYPGFLQAIGSSVYIWNKRGVFVLELADLQPKWAGLPDSPLKPANFQFNRRWLTAMTTSGDMLYLSARSDTGCGERLIVAWNGEAWRTLPQVSLATTDRPDCSYANQIGPTPGGVVIWYTFDHLTMAYSAELDVWREIERIPVPGSEEVSGAVPLIDGYFLVPQQGTAAVFDAANEAWIPVEIPASGSETDMVWTGTELLSWSTRPYGDAWRWTPEQITLVNSATTR